MLVADVIQFSWQALTGAKVRSILMLIAMAIGVASVIILTALGEGARSYVTNEFSSIGTNLLIVLPGKSETAGASPSTFIGETPRDLTLEDSIAITRIPSVRYVAPVIVGTADVSHAAREREVIIFGTSHEMINIQNYELSQGKFLPAGDVENATPVCVLGAKLSKELFGNQRAVGEWVRISDRRYRVVGVLNPRGPSMGMVSEDIAILPVASAQILFNRASLFRILIQVNSREAIPWVRQRVIDTIRERHQGEEDITVISQDAILETFDNIFRVLTLAVAGIAAISLAVAGILIMNVMLIAVSQRRSEIGLLKALGAPAKQIRNLFLVEALLLSALGALIGLTVGQLGQWMITKLYPNFILTVPWWAILAAVGVALSAGLIFGVMPARRAARLDPVLALSRK